jgi:hypothetical protein
VEHSLQVACRHIEFGVYPRVFEIKSKLNVLEGSFCPWITQMLKSKRVGDSYQNVYLSNLKILSTTRHNTITDIKLCNIDTALREIEACKVGTDSAEEVPAPAEEVLPPSPVAAPELPQYEPGPPPPHIPILMSIQYHDVDHLTGAVEGFLRDYRDVDGRIIESVQTCKHCLSTEVQHAGHIADISHWRKTLMSKLNLPTSSHV